MRLLISFISITILAGTARAQVIERQGGIIINGSQAFVDHVKNTLDSLVACKDCLQKTDMRDTIAWLRAANKRRSRSVTIQVLAPGALIAGSDHGNATIPASYADACNGKGTDAFIYWDDQHPTPLTPCKPIDPQPGWDTGCTVSTPLVGLAHELAHARLFMQGTAAPPPKGTRQNDNMVNEGYAASHENIIRRSCEKICLRDCHHYLPIPLAYIKNRAKCPMPP
jgi:hypothetical protein